MKIYCIYDKKGELMNPPFTQANNAMAIRQFQMMINQPSTPERSNIIHDYASDFALYYLGEFDEKTCQFTAEWPVVLLSNADELLTPAE
nr:MAG TPA: DNA binding protein [Microviridae sp.]